MSDNGLWKAAALASQLGFSVACPMAVFIAGGVWADSKLGTRPWLFFLGLLVGIVAAGAALYQVVVATPNKRRNPVAKAAPDKIEPNGESSEVSRPKGNLPISAEDEDEMQFEDYGR